MVCSLYHDVCLKLMRLDLHGSVFSFHFLPDIEDEACGLAKPIESHISTSVAPYDVSRIAQKNVSLSDAEKVQFLDNCWRPAASSTLDTAAWSQKTNNIPNEMARSTQMASL